MTMAPSITTVSFALFVQRKREREEQRVGEEFLLSPRKIYKEDFLKAGNKLLKPYLKPERCLPLGLKNNSDRDFLNLFLSPFFLSGPLENLVEASSL